MKHGNPDEPGFNAGNPDEPTEQQLRHQIEDLQRQLHEQQRGQFSPGALHWKPSGITIGALLLGIIAVLVAAFFAGYIPMQRRDALVHAEGEQRAQELPRMATMRVGLSPAQGELSLPGTMQALTEAPILARTDGYLKKRLVDIGDRVHAGQPLAEIDAPEVDQQIRQAKAAVEQAQAAVEQAQASLEQAKANRDLARLTADRWKALAAQGVVSKQENDQYQAQLLAQNANVQALEKGVVAQKSNVAAAQANLARLEDLQGYRVVKAPFDGIITQRNVDLGALVTTGNTLLFRVAQTGTMRTYVNVAQTDAASVRVGQPARLTVSGFPGRVFAGTIARTANALDPTSRTMLVEVDVPNPDGALLPGSYVDVELSNRRARPPLMVPAQALIERSDGSQVALVRPDSTLHLQKVIIGKDYGDRVEIVQGLEEGATILAEPTDTAREGVKIIPAHAETSAP